MINETKRKLNRFVTDRKELRTNSFAKQLYNGCLYDKNQLCIVTTWHT